MISEKAQDNTGFPYPNSLLGDSISTTSRHKNHLAGAQKERKISTKIESQGRERK
jgi:hypothetical protein